MEHAQKGNQMRHGVKVVDSDGVSLPRLMSLLNFTNYSSTVIKSTAVRPLFDVRIHLPKDALSTLSLTMFRSSRSPCTLRNGTGVFVLLGRQPFGMDLVEHLPYRLCNVIKEERRKREGFRRTTGRCTRTCLSNSLSNTVVRRIPV